MQLLAYGGYRYTMGCLSVVRDFRRSPGIVSTEQMRFREVIVFLSNMFPWQTHWQMVGPLAMEMMSEAIEIRMLEGVFFF